MVAGITAGVPALVARTARALKALVAHRRRGGPRPGVPFAGARIVELYSVGPILEGIGLNVTVWSYIDRLYVGILGCPDQQDDLRRLAEVLPDALSELEAVGASPSA